ncbi:MAG: DUF1045 domain-containing protein [Deltaproteobacteria bacterium]|jgi:hypothetical protein|nr:DUF1045 domain-containing protein [Deltaproteobacteria bacterium]
MSTRYAVYYVPKKDSLLYSLGRDTLGYCIYEGLKYSSPNPVQVKAAKYGFHGTIVAPFRTNLSAQVLAGTLSWAALRLSPVNLTGLKAMALPNGFPALALVDPNPELSKIESSLVRLLTPLRLPLNLIEIQSRGQLPPKQLEYALQWGYPWVFEYFRFHLTLGDVEDQPMLSERVCRLSKVFTPELLAGEVLDQLSLCVQPSPHDSFKVLATFGLDG